MSSFLVTFSTNLFRMPVKSNLILGPMRLFHSKTTTTPSFFHVQSSNYCSAIQDNISTLHLKKRPVRKKKLVEGKVPGLHQVVAFATAEEYKLERLIDGLNKQGLYEPQIVDNAVDVVHAIAKIEVDSEPRDLFVFREGSVVLWNCTDLESSNVLNFLQQYELDGYSEVLVQKEMEVMNYRYQNDEGNQTSQLEKNGDFLLSNPRNSLDKYTFSNAMALSVKLGIWEASLDKYIDKIEFVTEDLKKGNKIRMTQDQVLQRHGELFALRHLINLSSDLLDTPDFYWENEQLEKLYMEICQYFNISKRTKVGIMMNEITNFARTLDDLTNVYAQTGNE